MSAAVQRDPGERVGFFCSGLAAADSAVFAAVSRETGRQRTEIELIASENIVSRAVLEATGSPLTNKYAVTSGLRLGSPACTTRGFGVEEFRQVGRLIVEVLDGLAAHGESGNGLVEARVKQAATELCARFPIYP